MKVKRFNENKEKIYIYSKIYGGKYNPIDDIFKDLEIFDNHNVEYNILTTKNTHRYIGVYAQLPDNYNLDNIPTEYKSSGDIFDNKDEMKEKRTDINKKSIKKEDIIPLIQSDKFNI